MFNDIIKLNYEEDFEVALDCTYRYDRHGYFVKGDKQETFTTIGIIGYSVLKNQIILKGTSRDIINKGIFKDSVETEQYNKFSHLEDVYVYYRLSKSNYYNSVSRFVTNKLILEPEEKVLSDTHNYLDTNQSVVSHEDGGYVLVTYDKDTNKVIRCSERFDYL